MLIKMFYEKNTSANTAPQEVFVLGVLMSFYGFLNETH